MASGRALYERLRQPVYEFAKFAVVGIAGVFITNAVYGLLYVHQGLGPVSSATVATIVAAIGTYLGNRYWSFRTRRRAGVAHEIIVFAVLNGVGLLIQDATVAFNYYLLRLGHDKVAVFVALNLGIAIATLFRFWSYRQFVWAAPRPVAADHLSANRFPKKHPGVPARNAAPAPTDQLAGQSPQNGQRETSTGLRG
jgi:putative flippase GtrA